MFNISKETTVKEIVRIKGLNEYRTRMAIINISAGPTNAVEVCTEIFGMPPLEKLLEEFQVHEAVSI